MQGDDPPRDRTGELRVLGFPTRHLGPIQMTTDTALGVTKLVVQDKSMSSDISGLSGADWLRVFSSLERHPLRCMFPYRGLTTECSAFAGLSHNHLQLERECRDAIPLVPFHIEEQRTDNSNQVMLSKMAIQSSLLACENISMKTSTRVLSSERTCFD